MFLLAIILLVVLLILWKFIEPFASYMVDLGTAQSHIILVLVTVLYAFGWWFFYLLVTN